MKLKYKVVSHQMAADLHTPVSLYLKLRDQSSSSILLESSDYNSAHNSRSYIALEPLASISINHSISQVQIAHKCHSQKELTAQYSTQAAIEEFTSLFEIEQGSHHNIGLFGYTAYDSVKYFENIEVNSYHQGENDAPDMLYYLFKYTLIYDHYHSTLTLHELVPSGQESQMASVISAIENRNFSQYSFTAQGECRSTINDEDYKAMVRQGIAHCKRGDVFQIVLSRRFLQPFSGDDFALYRALRSINPSPYLFYFDLGGFRIFGSSPETHCMVEKGKISIDPIAGTAFRSPDAQKDKEAVEALIADPKENSEHVMLVDLARNDLSRNASNVKVELYKQVQYFSHVVHLVSRVSGRLNPTASPIKAYIDTFPAGTLSGAPKVRAMQLINQIEPHNRGIYGGAIGFIGFDGSVNHAITIRTFVSRSGTLAFQAGAGVVALSSPERELEEVNRKLGALSRAIELASKL